MRKLCQDISYLKNPVFMDKTMTADLDDDMAVEISFVSSGVPEKYDALQMRIFEYSRELDSKTFKFGDLPFCSETLAIEDSGSGPAWGPNEPDESNYLHFFVAMNTYLAWYAPFGEQEPDMGTDGQRM